MKIVHFIPSFDVGGAEFLAVRLCAAIKREHPDSEVFLVSLYDPTESAVYREAVRSDVKILSLGKKRGLDVRMMWRIYRLLRELRPDIVNTHLVCIAYSFFPCLLMKGFAKFHTFHNLARKENLLPVRVLQYVAMKMFGWKPVALSRAVQASIAKTYGQQAPIISNGVPIDSSVMLIEKKELRRKCLLPEEGTFLISVARLAEQKNQLLLLDSFENVARENRECHLLLVGEDYRGGEYLHLLKEKVAKFDIDVRHRVHFLGLRDDVPALLCASDIFVMSSDWEGQPLTLLESMGYGLPAVCTSVGGIPDVIRDGVSGLLVPKGDSQGFGEAMRRLVADSVLAKALGRNAQDEFSKAYHIRHTAREYMNLYRQAKTVLAGK